MTEGEDVFVPLVRNPHVQTVLGALWPAGIDARRFPEEEAVFPTAPGVRVLGRFNRAIPSGLPRRLAVLIHGLTGSANSGDCLRAASLFLKAGFDTLRLNIRNCGRTEGLCSTLYHSGLTDDLRFVAERVEADEVFILGYSVGGNIALKLAGEWGASAPSRVKAVAAVSPPIDLGECARALGEPSNRFYERRFLRRLRRILERKAVVQPGAWPLDGYSRLRSIVEFDDRFTAPAFGFRDARDYYRKASSSPLLPEIRVPSLIIAAEDDPFIPFGIYEKARGLPNVRLIATRFGGHTAFLSRRRPRLWAEDQALRFCQEKAR